MATYKVVRKVQQTRTVLGHINRTNNAYSEKCYAYEVVEGGSGLTWQAAKELRRATRNSEIILDVLHQEAQHDPKQQPA